MTSDEALAATVREEWGRLVSLLLAQFRRLDLVEDALGDAVEAAARTWPRDGTPDRPAAWLLTTARRRVVDRLRAEAVALRREPLLLVEARDTEPAPMADPGGLVEDERLRLVLMCCHPTLAPEVASALALRLVVGVPTTDIARLFLVPEATVAARITRGKKKVVAAGIPFAVPDAAVLPQRLETVAQTAYLAFTAGYAPGSGPDLLRAELAGEAVRLVRVTLAQAPDEPVLRALLALLLLQHSRRDARVDDDGRLVLLPDQDRSRWHHDEVAEAVALLATVPVGHSLLVESYRLQGLVAVEHATAATAADTRWDRVTEAYDALLQVNPSPAARLAAAVALAERDGPDAGLAALDGLDAQLPGSHRVPAVRGELLARRGDTAAALAALDTAIALCANEVERDHLTRRRAGLSGRTRPDRDPEPSD
ncbi:RNA polymerase sigma factor [Oryzobacter telluris]|uniref:RNA polymerase sigma factor n=1 Tax=Oryzobacter telluris TaxID=3149179 RepID=UPI00370DBF47